MGDYTYGHPGLVALAIPGGAGKRTSAVAEALNRSGRFPHYAGPVNGDVSSLAWEFWERGDPPPAVSAGRRNWGGRLRGVRPARETFARLRRA